MVTKKKPKAGVPSSRRSDANLRALAVEMGLRDRHSSRYPVLSTSPAVVSEAQEAFGLDYDNHADRLVAIVERAFAKAQELAARVEDFETANAQRSAAIAALDRGVAKIAPQLQNIRNIYRTHLHKDADVSDLLNALEVIAEHRSTLNSIRPSSRELADLPRRFFLLRLAEAFAFNVGEPPSISQRTAKPGSNLPPAGATWRRFFDAACDYVGLPSQGLDQVLRRAARHSRTQLVRFAEWPDVKGRKVIELADLPSANLHKNFWRAGQSVNFGSAQQKPKKSKR